MHLPYDTIVFDLDGTLTDSRPGIESGIRYALEQLNRPCPDPDTLRLFLGPPLAESFMIHCGLSEEEARIATEHYRKRYVDGGGMFENAVFPGIRPLLKRLKRDGVRLCVATGKPMNGTEPILKQFGLYGLFNAIACPGLNDMHADKAALIRRCLADDPKGSSARVLMVGDIDGDILGGQRAGTDTCAALWGYGTDVESAHPTFACRTPFDLYERLYGEKLERRGYFISLEGLDGCGKTTQQRLLASTLQQNGYETLLTREPGGCPIAEAVRGILLTKEDTHMRDETEALLFAAARAQHVHDTIAPAIAEGKVVLCDRFVDSSIAYQGAGRGLGEDWIRQINRAAGRLPDLTIYVRLSAQEAIRRRFREDSPDRIEQSGAAFFERTEKAFDRLAAQETDRFVTVDGNGSIEEIAGAIARAVLPRVEAALAP